MAIRFCHNSCPSRIVFNQSQFTKASSWIKFNEFCGIDSLRYTYQIAFIITNRFRIWVWLSWNQNTNRALKNDIKLVTNGPSFKDQVSSRNKFILECLYQFYVVLFLNVSFLEKLYLLEHRNNDLFLLLIILILSWNYFDDCLN